MHGVLLHLIFLSSALCSQHVKQDSVFACEIYIPFLLPSCKSLSGKGRGSVQHITSIYLDVRRAGCSTE